MHRHPKVEIVSSQTAFRGPIFRVLRESVRLPSGLRQDLDVVEHPGAVAVAALVGEGEMLLVRQYRHAAGEWLLEVPAGRVEEGEAPLAAARRELEEETGHRAALWRELCGFYTAPGFCSEWMALYLALSVEPVPGGGRGPDVDEQIAIVRMAPERVLERARDAKTLLAACAVLRGDAG